MSFVEIQFPPDISYGSSGGPVYTTDIVITAGGHEQRNVQWQQARARYNVAHGVKTKTQLAQLITFFRARKGRAHGFRFKDWTDYQLINQQIGIGDGVRKTFPLIKTYTSGGVTETRSITKPVAGTISIAVNGTAISSGVSVATTSGVVTFTTAPTNGAVITASCEFDVPVRFDTDRLSATLDEYGVHSWLDISLIEVRGIV
jgi:uncharacterized protein (TIGR02217 family)